MCESDEIDIESDSVVVTDISYMYILNPSKTSLPRVKIFHLQFISPDEIHLTINRKKQVCSGMVTVTKHAQALILRFG